MVPQRRLDYRCGVLLTTGEPVADRSADRRRGPVVDQLGDGIDGKVEQVPFIKVVGSMRHLQQPSDQVTDVCLAARGQCSFGGVRGPQRGHDVLREQGISRDRALERITGQARRHLGQEHAAAVLAQGEKLEQLAGGFRVTGDGGGQQLPAAFDRRGDRSVQLG
jgi:hypothetical protein